MIKLTYSGEIVGGIKTKDDDGAPILCLICAEECFLVGSVGEHYRIYHPELKALCGLLSQEPKWCSIFTLRKYDYIVLVTVHEDFLSLILKDK